MYRVALTGALPPHISRLPRIFPESRLKGATPTSDERRLWVMVPSSGSSAGSDLASTGPTPGTLLSSSSLRRQTSLCWTASSSSWSVRTSSFWSQRMWAAMRLATPQPPSGWPIPNDQPHTMSCEVRDADFSRSTFFGPRRTWPTPRR